MNYTLVRPFITIYVYRQSIVKLYVIDSGQYTIESRRESRLCNVLLMRQTLRNHTNNNRFRGLY